MRQAYVKLKESYLALRYGPEYLKESFGRIHALNLWGNSESVSGPGSTLEKTAVLRQELPRIIKELKVNTILDAPCGDFHWMRQVSLDCEYIGVDVVPELVAHNVERYGQKFLIRDITKDELPRANLILCRDCLIHLSYRYISRALENFKRTGAKYLLTTHSPGAENRDILSGQCRPLDLQAKPFYFRQPIRLIEEENGHLIGLWRL